MIITREAFMARIRAEVLSDEELEFRINNAIEVAATTAANATAMIYVDVGPAAMGRMPSPSAIRAVQLAEAAGWKAEIDGRSGHLVIDPQ